MNHLKQLLRFSAYSIFLIMSTSLPAQFESKDERSQTFADSAQAEMDYAATDWKLIWNDEFDHEGAPDPAKWNYEYGLVRNNESQFYTRNRRENSRVEKGRLIIEARKEPWSENGAQADYTSASLITKGLFDFTYGKVEISAQMPKGRGTWPALWTLGSNIDKVSWPMCGEIDLVEFVGHTPDKLHFSVHTMAFNHVKGTHKTTFIRQASPYDAFHRYGIVWNKEKITWYFDGKKVFDFANDGQGKEHWPFDEPQYLLMNLAIGGAWGGKDGIDPAIFPVSLHVDYVKVWQR